jgi:NAD(P)-dependent dehydrogenase (short-subunit alcohol dehydrogenase family)
MHAVITGANRGIGLEFVRQLLDRGAAVTAAARDTRGAKDLNDLVTRSGGRLVVHACDVARDESVRAFAAAVGDRAVDLLVNNAGVYGGDRQAADDMDFDDALQTYNVNALGALRVALALRANLARATNAKIVSITSGMGSIADNRSGGYYAYRMAKAALNMAAKTLAVDLRDEGIASAVINPGWVQTDMGGSNATTPVQDSVRGMLRQIDALGLANTGTFLNRRGGEYPW